MTIRDHLGREVPLDRAPQRIVSLCPSQTETLVDLGAGERLVGRTKFCIHPEAIVKDIPEIGGTKQVRMADLDALAPDLILAEMEEQTPELVAELEENYPVFVTRVENIPDALTMIRDVGALLDGAFAHLSTAQLPQKPIPADRPALKTAQTLATEIDRSLQAIAPLAQPMSCVYLIWENPVMGVGANTYINSVLSYMGLVNGLLTHEGRYPTLSHAEIKTLSPSVLMLSSEPFPYKTKHLEVYQALLPQTQVMCVDGEMFSWYGTRMQKAAAYLAQLANKLV